jgi:DNA-binding XRE family transcriptional regulator
MLPTLSSRIADAIAATDLQDETLRDRHQREPSIAQSSLRQTLILTAAEIASAARKSTGLGMTVFAKKAGVSPYTFGRIEHGQGHEPPNLETLARIARAGGKTLVITLKDGPT